MTAAAFTDGAAAAVTGLLWVAGFVAVWLAAGAVLLAVWAAARAAGAGASRLWHSRPAWAARARLEVIRYGRRHADDLAAARRRRRQAPTRRAD